MKPFRSRTMASMLAASFVVASPLAFAQEDVNQLKQQIDELDQKIRVLQRLREIDEEASAAKAGGTPIFKAGEKGFGLQSADGAFEIRLRGLIQTDYRHFDQGTNISARAAPGASTAGYLNNEEANDGFLLRRVRPTIEGTVFGKYGFRFTPEFGDGKSQVVDAYIDARFAPWLKVRAGKYKPFVGLERLQSGGDIKFIERSYVTSALLPNRDVGASVHGDLFEGRLSYALGVHNGVPDGGDNTTASDINSDKDFAARLFTTPLKGADSILAGLGFGLAGTYGDVKGRVINTVNGSGTELTGGYKTEGQQTFFRYIDSGSLTSGLTNAVGNPGADWLVHADGKRHRIAPQAHYYHGSLGLLAEYAQVSQQVSIGKTSSNRTTLNHRAWEISSSYLLTGEDASFRAVKPRQEFDINKGGWGAWELVARYSRIDLDDDAFVYGTSSGSATAALNTQNHWLYADPKISSRSAKTWTAGVNWYLNQNAKFSVNYAQTSFEGGGGPVIAPTTNWAGLVSTAAAADRKDERVILARFQVAF